MAQCRTAEIKSRNDARNKNEIEWKISFEIDLNLELQQNEKSTNKKSTVKNLDVRWVGNSFTHSIVQFRRQFIQVCFSFWVSAKKKTWNCLIEIYRHLWKLLFFSRVAVAAAVFGVCESSTIVEKPRDFRVRLQSRNRLKSVNNFQVFFLHFVQMRFS